MARAGDQKSCTLYDFAIQMLGDKPALIIQFDDTVLYSCNDNVAEDSVTLIASTEMAVELVRKRIDSYIGDYKSHGTQRPAPDPKYQSSRDAEFVGSTLEGNILTVRCCTKHVHASWRCTFHACTDLKAVQALHDTLTDLARFNTATFEDNELSFIDDK